LGVKVGDLDLFFQTNAPRTVSPLLQRMGRTDRRAGQAMNTAFLCENAEAALQAVELIELAQARRVETVPRKSHLAPI
jgi:ATP-dependent helicase Lhr and Lhr-like helicase